MENNTIIRCISYNASQKITHNRRRRLN